MDAGPQVGLCRRDRALAVGDNTIDLHYIPVLTQPLGSAARDDVYGVLGIDGLDQLTATLSTTVRCGSAATAE